MGRGIVQSDTTGKRELGKSREVIGSDGQLYSVTNPANHKWVAVDSCGKTVQAKSFAAVKRLLEAKRVAA